MGESPGLLKVMVVKGKRLVIRDFKSSDPYVVVKLGSQVVLRCLWICAFSFLFGFPVFVQPDNLSYSKLNHVHLRAL